MPSKSVSHYLPLHHTAAPALPMLSPPGTMSTTTTSPTTTKEQQEPRSKHIHLVVILVIFVVVGLWSTPASYPHGSSFTLGRTIDKQLQYTKQQPGQPLLRAAGSSAGPLLLEDEFPQGLPHPDDDNVAKSVLLLEDEFPQGLPSPDDDDDDTGGVVPAVAKEPPLVAHLLSVPFYIYPNLGLPSTLTIRDEIFDDRLFDRDSGLATLLPKKHADDYYLVKAALDHPMRTMDPSQAKLFLVPAPLNQILDCIGRERIRGQICMNVEDGGTDESRSSSSATSTQVCQMDLVAHIDEQLGASQWFQRHQGRDHIAIMSSYGWGDEGRKPGRAPGPKVDLFMHEKPDNLLKCSKIVFEDRIPYATYTRDTLLKTGGDDKHANERVHLPNMYVGSACPAATKKTSDFAMIASMQPGNPRYVDRANICDWLAVNATTSTTTTDYKMPVCGRGAQCPALADAKFGFHVQGDTYTANRLFDTLLSESVPIFTRRLQYKLLPSWIDWKQVSYYASVKERDVFLRALDKATSDDDAYEVKLANVRRNQDLWDLEHSSVPLDMYLYQFQARLFPDTIVPVRTRFDILQLPAPSEATSRTD